jgi:preprotein translocase subunit SecA
VVAILDRILRAGEGRALKQLMKIAEEVNSHESTFVAMSDDDLRSMTEKFKARLENGEDLDDILPEAFAVVREASKRTLGQRHYDVQIVSQRLNWAGSAHCYYQRLFSRAR